MMSSRWTKCQVCSLLLMCQQLCRCAESAAPLATSFPWNQIAVHLSVYTRISTIQNEMCWPFYNTALVIKLDTSLPTSYLRVRRLYRLNTQHFWLYLTMTTHITFVGSTVNKPVWTALHCCCIPNVILTQTSLCEVVGCFIGSKTS